MRWASFPLLYVEFSLIIPALYVQKIHKSEEKGDVPRLFFKVNWDALYIDQFYQMKVILFDPWYTQVVQEPQIH